jgi:hypothetical protein
MKKTKLFTAILDGVIFSGGDAFGTLKKVKKRRGGTFMELT